MGNVTNRVLNMISRYCDDKMPAASTGGFDTALEDALWKETADVAKEMTEMAAETEKETVGQEVDTNFQDFSLTWGKRMELANVPLSI